MNNEHDEREFSRNQGVDVSQSMTPSAGSRVSVLRAWSIHAFTASGVVFAMLALMALLNSNVVACLLWLGAAMMIDGVDGNLARKYEIKSVLPNFDGVILDVMVDYLTWSFIPAIFIFQFIPLPPYLSALSVAIILLSSMFCYCNVNEKSEDSYFVGFPAAWNIVAAYFYVFQLPPWVSFAVILVMAGLTMTQIKFLHPFRVKLLMPINIAVTVAWCVCMTALILSSPVHAAWAVWGLVASSLYFAAMCIARTIRGH
ncbi:phosphatidylcholine synthase [Carnimonas nigrificans]|uniref:phosphatidylcholine synthase n=1 Tax=Carnimonas nigrificans TaxID=64323 RepID=UPI00316ACA41